MLGRRVSRSLLSREAGSAAAQTGAAGLLDGRGSGGDHVETLRVDAQPMTLASGPFWEDKQVPFSFWLPTLL